MPTRPPRSLAFFLLVLALAGTVPLRAQIITSIAGGGPASFIGNGGPATLASIGGPDDIALDSRGDLYIADPGYLLIRKVDMATGIITTVAGDGTFIPGYTGDGGPATLASLNYPSGIAFDANDNMYISDYYNGVIRKVDKATGIITTFAGNGVGGYSGDGGPATLASLNAPLRLKFDSSGNLLIADSENNVIRSIDMTTGIITTVVGNGTPGYSGDGGPATLASLQEPQGMDFDTSGNLYFTDSTNRVVRKVDKATGIITTIAGNGASGYSGDGGPATLASFSDEPDGILVGCNNNIYITDDINNTIRMVSGTTGIISTIAGDVTVTGGVTVGLAGHSGDGGPPLGAQMWHPEALIFSTQGSMLVADYGYGYIRQITLACALTPTYTPTFTNTPTLTPTPTASFTQTPTPTVTNSPTSTGTPTPSSTPSPSPTPTDTPTTTATSTLTSTPTITPTPTWTFTLTASPTATLALSLAKTVSKSQAQSGDLLDYSLAVTLGNFSLAGAIVTDSLPSGVSFVGIGNPSAGAATFDPASDSIQWTLPDPLSPGVYTLGYQVKVVPFVPGDSELVNQARLSYTGSASPLSASATVKVQGLVTVKIGIYNEAGEWIRDLQVRQFSQPVNSLTLSVPAITSLNGPNGHIDLYCQGFYLGTWDGLDALGDPLTNGTYHIKVDNVDAFGSVTTVTQQAMVSRSLAKVSVSIYNEAGEVVRHLFAWADDPNGAEMTDLILSPEVVQPAGSTGQPAQIQVLVQTSGSGVTLSWDGTNDVGSPVSAGHYQIAAHWSDGQGASSDITRGLLVAPHGDPNGPLVLVRPNRLIPSVDGVTQAVFSSPAHPEWVLKVRIYTLAGELVKRLEGFAGTPATTWDISDAASGLYIAQVDCLNTQGGKTGSRTLKVLVLH